MKTQYQKARAGFIPLIMALFLGAMSLTTAAQGKRVSIGTGSGELNYPTAQATLNLQDGDTLVINAGVYQGITLSNITASPGKRIYVINNGLVEIAYSWVGFNMNYLTNVTIEGDGTPGITYGFYIHDMNIRGMDILHRLEGTYLSYFSFANIQDYGIYLLDNSLVYNGSNSSLFYDLKFTHFKFHNLSQSPFQFGDWNHLDLGLTGMIRKLEIAYCNIDSIMNNGEIIHLNRTVNANIHHNVIKHTSYNDFRHNGIVFLRGNGDVHHNYMSDNWGNGIRGQGFGLDSIGVINFYNNVVVNSRKYSGAEANTFSNDINAASFTHYANYNIYNNTFGNLQAADWQASMVDTYDAMGGTIEIKNNLGFNIERDASYMGTGDYIYAKWNATIPDTSNNRYSATYAGVGLVNDSSCLLNINSPAIDAGVNFNWITDDIDGVARPQNGIFDIGAHEYLSGVVYPVANAGSTINIVLPKDSTLLNGSASYNPGGGTLKYKWTVVSGPASFLFTTDSIATPMFSQLTTGTYLVKLVVTNSTGRTNESTVTVVVNAAPPPPVANAGSDINITLPVNSTTLNGNGSSNPTGGALTYAWSQVAGPSTAGMTGGTGATPALSGLVEGTYQFKLIVTNVSGISASATVNVVVNPAPPPGSQPPVANAGGDATITLPTNSVALDGSASYEPGGGTITYSWAVQSGPSTYTLTGGGTATPTLSGLVAGTYQLALTVTNANSLTNTDLVEVTVNPQPAPVVSAGADIVITLPTNSTSLDASASNQPGGGTLTYAWTFATGPSTPNLSGANTVNPVLSNLVEGVYTINLTVTNATGGNASASVQVTLKPAAPAVSPNPVAKAGGSKTLTLPANSTALDGTASYNPAGGNLTYAWSKILGPSSFSMSGANTATPNISGLTKGVYQLGLTVTNAAGISASDVMTITVNGAPVPVAKVGADTTVSFPNGFALLHDAGSYAVGSASIVSYSWKEISGPTIAMFGNDTMSFSSAGNLEPGDYIFELTVTDNNGLSGSARMKVSVVNTFRLDKMISVYPNPCRDQLHIRLITDSTGPMTIRITSLAGVIVFTGSYQKNQLQVDEPIPVGRLPQGMYIVEVIIGNQVQLLTKFVKQ